MQEMEAAKVRIREQERRKNNSELQAAHLVKAYSEKREEAKTNIGKYEKDTGGLSLFLQACLAARSDLTMTGAAHRLPPGSRSLLTTNLLQIRSGFNVL